MDNMIRLIAFTGIFSLLSIACAPDRPVASKMLSKSSALTAEEADLQALEKEEGQLEIKEDTEKDEVPGTEEEIEQIPQVSLCAKANQYSMAQEAEKALALLCDGDEFSEAFNQATSGNNFWSTDMTTRDLPVYEAGIIDRRTLDYSVVAAFLLPVSMADFQAKVAPEMMSRPISWRASIVRMKQIPEFVGVKTEKESDDVSLGLKFKMDQQSSNRRGLSKYDYEVDMFNPKDAIGNISYERVTVADYGTKRRDTISFIIPKGDDQVMVVTATYYVQGIQGFRRIVQRVAAEGVRVNLNRLMGVVEDYQNGEL